MKIDRKWQHLILVMILAFLISLIESSYGLGVLVSGLSLWLQGSIRKLFYQRLFEEKNFSKGLYSSYVLLTFMILWLPLLLAFIIPDYINPYAMAAVFLVHRVLMFIYYDRSE